ncbi:hypothetical protein KKC36_02690 [Patescibacteria group bacterium]|nr:hypothetical protein [Patescibacteria group bacterium]
MKIINIFKKTFKISFLTVILLELSTKISHAVCPLCIITVGAGLGLSRFLGIDDLATGVWLGGFITSFSFLSTNWLYKKEFFKKFKKIYLTLGNYFLYILLTFLPLHFAGITGHYNKIAGIDKLLIGTFVGTLVFLASIYLDKKVREKYKKQLFNYQKVVFPVSLLAILSLIFYFITR